MEMAPYIAVLGLIMYKIIIPKMVNIVAITNAVRTAILPAGMGLFLVRAIKASRSFSIIWLKAFEAPTIKYPPNANKIRVLKLTTSTPSM